MALPIKTSELLIKTGDGSGLSGVLKIDQATQQLIENNHLRYDESVPPPDHPRDIPDKAYTDAAASALGINYFLRKADHDPAITDPDAGPNYKTLTNDPSEREATEGYTERAAIADGVDYVVQGWAGPHPAGIPKLLKGTYALYAQVEKISGRDVRFFGRLYVRNVETDAETQVGADSALSEVVSVNGVRENEFMQFTLANDVVIADNEQVVGKIWVRGVSGGNPATVRVYYCGDINSYFALPTNKAALDQMYAPLVHDHDDWLDASYTSPGLFFVDGDVAGDVEVGQRVTLDLDGTIVYDTIAALNYEGEGMDDYTNVTLSGDVITSDLTRAMWGLIPDELPDHDDDHVQLHDAVTVNAPIALDGQDVSLVNNAATPATVTTIDVGTLDTESDVKIPTSKAVATAIAAGTGKDNLTEFTSQTAHRVFYSNGSGVVTELALGADETYFRSNGPSAAPSFDTPAGGGGAPTVQSINSTETTTTVNLANGTVINLTMGHNCDLAFSNVPAGYVEVLIRFIQDATGSRTISNFAALAQWAHGVSPDLSTAAGAKDDTMFYTLNGGANWTATLINAEVS